LRFLTQRLLAIEWLLPLFEPSMVQRHTGLDLEAGSQVNLACGDFTRRIGRAKKRAACIRHALLTLRVDGWAANLFGQVFPVASLAKGWLAVKGDRFHHQEPFPSSRGSTGFV
jgi:hypothetical protein